MKIFITIIQHDLKLARRSGINAWLGIMFFLTITTLFPLTSDVHEDSLRPLGMSILWMSALLSLLLGFDGLFSDPHHSGALDILLKISLLNEFVVLAKIIACWLLCALPLVVTLPWVGLLYDLSSHDIINLWLALMLATPLMTFIGAFAAALALEARRRHALISFITLPLSAPLLIFGAAAPQDNNALIFLASLLALLAPLFLWLTARILEERS